MTRWLIVAALAVGQSDVGTPVDVSKLAVAKPALVCEINLDELKGELRRLSWSPDGRNLHVQTAESNGVLNDYIVTLPDGVVSRAFGEPEWGTQYWAMKSSLAAPGQPTLRLEIQENNRRTRPMPFTGGTANGGAYTPDVKNPVDAYEAEVTLRFLGIELGNWINGAPMAGDTFGWGPSGSGAIVYVGHGDRLTLMDRDKNKKVIGAMKGATLPAWSNDGTRLAFLQKTAKRRYRLMTAAVGRATI